LQRDTVGPKSTSTRQVAVVGLLNRAGGDSSRFPG
jgi:hypothetical protein